MNASVDGTENSEATERANPVITGVPGNHLRDTLDTIDNNLDEDTILVSPAFGMKQEKYGLQFHPSVKGNATQLAARAAPDEFSVIGAFHNHPAQALSEFDPMFQWDTVVVGENRDVKDTVIGIAEGIDEPRALVGRPLANARQVKTVTPPLVNLARYHARMHDVGPKFC